MNCEFCGGQFNFSLEKQFDDYGLDKVEYWRCRSCNFVVAKTLADMPESLWLKLNEKYHSSYQFTENNPDDLRWQERIVMQADVLADIDRLGLIPHQHSWVDYGCGDGKLSDILESKFGLKLAKFDPYVHDLLYLKVDQLAGNTFDLVVNTSVFEHVRNRKTLDQIASLVSENGVLAIHTLVSEKVPVDSEWFYFLPVHCSFFSNKCMQILFDEWGFKSSIYHVSSRLWLWFKKKPEWIEEVIAGVNKKASDSLTEYHFKRGFMDYWK